MLYLISGTVRDLNTKPDETYLGPISMYILTDFHLISQNFSKFDCKPLMHNKLEIEQRCMWELYPILNRYLKMRK